MYFKDMFHNRVRFVTSITVHLIAQIMHLSMVIMFYDSAQTNDYICRRRHLYLFVISAVLIVVYKLISFGALIVYGVICDHKRKLFFMQLFELKIIRTVQLQYLFQHNGSYHVIKLIKIIYSISVSTSMCYIQTIYLMSYGRNNLMLLSLIFSFIDVLISQSCYDSISTENIEQNLNFKLNVYQRQYAINGICKGWTVQFRCNWQLICRLLWRSIDIVSTVFLYSLIWLIMGWITFMIVMSVLFIVTLIITVGKYKHYDGSIFVFTSNIVLVEILCYQVSSHVIYLILLTIWITKKFECVTCPMYHERHKIIDEYDSLFGIFLFCWINRVTNCCWLFVVGNFDCEEASFHFFKITKHVYFERLWYIYQSNTNYNHINHKFTNNINASTMLKRAIIHGQTIIIHKILQNNCFALNVIENFISNDNILDYVFKYEYDRNNNDKSFDSEKWISYLFKIHEKFPDLQSTKHGRNIFLCACYIGDIQCIQKLIELTPHIVNSVDNNKLNAYSIAHIGNQPQICMFLENNYKICGPIPVTSKLSYKMVLLGAGSTGKSTLFRNLKLIYKDGFEESEYTECIPIVRRNMVSVILNLLKHSSFIAEQHKEYEIDLQTDTLTVDAIENIVRYCRETFEDDLNWNDMMTLANDLGFIWNLNAIQKTYFKHVDYNFANWCNMEYFFNQIHTIFHQDYFPTDEDIIKVRIRTTGLIHNIVTINDTRFVVTDVGGNRNERRKWIHCLEEVDAILFFVPLTACNEVLFEDEQCNQMKEIFDLWNQLIHLRFFNFTKIYLLLNQNDIYRDLLKQKGINVINYWLNAFHEQNENHLLRGLDNIEDLYYSKCTLLSHGFIHNNFKYFPKDVIQLIDLYCDAYFEALYDNTINYVRNKFLESNKYPNRKIKSYVLTTTNTNQITKIMCDIENDIKFGKSVCDQIIDMQPINIWEYNPLIM